MTCPNPTTGIATSFLTDWNDWLPWITIVVTIASLIVSVGILYKLVK